MVASSSCEDELLCSVVVLPSLDSHAGADGGIAGYYGSV
jgi:hypothetical protein